jgi:hypothetical protein
MQRESKIVDQCQRQKESGLTVNEFCKNEGIAASTFYYRRKKLSKENSAQNFIPIVVKPSGAVSRQNPPVKNTGEADGEILLELVYPNGTKLRIKNDIDLTKLRELICLYD